MSAPGSTREVTWADVNRDVIRTVGMPGNTYFFWMTVIALTLFFFNDAASTEIYALGCRLALPEALWVAPCCGRPGVRARRSARLRRARTSRRPMAPIT